ncbi:glycosyltransferase family 4 protein [Caldifermentibacillus hisashii]|uniref:glycosyltransferase family 4 protein n=1 Tax=Caldifermentibacillus hisashii TaxID=996558 RepID=UPI001C0F8FB0|nr:glycosyltransferase family 4 protein [Caldifermentibacillus hisashii]MBU5343511.1 glycosyltransferase family 4 protein [Caldifermentibacillus hisashii]
MAKILLIHHSGYIGGAGLSLYNIAKMLSEKHDVIVYCSIDSPDMIKFLTSKEIQTKPIKNIGMISAYSGGPHIYQRTFIRSLLNIIKSRKLLKDIIRNEKPDVVGINSVTLSWIGKLLKYEGVKSICFVRETARVSPWTLLIKRYLNQYFDSVIFISEYDKKVFNCSKVKTEVVRDCINQDYLYLNYDREEACKILGLDKNKFNILFVGGTSKLKGWDVIKNAMNYLDDNFRLIVTGNRENNIEINSERITYLGVRSDMPLVYRASDVLVFPSTSPHQARPVFEAGVMNVPVIISNFKQTSEHIKHMENGLTFKPSSPIDLSKKIQLLYSNKQLRDNLTKANFYFAKQNHGFEENKAKLLDIITKL